MYMFRGRIPDIPDSWPVADSFVLPVAYCSIKFAKAMFRDAHHYFSMLCRNLESYSGVAAEIDGQLRRVIGLTQYEVDTLFPLKESSDIGQ